MALRCDRCGVESPLEQAFVKKLGLPHLETRISCPSCVDKRTTAFVKGLLLFFALCGGVGVLLVLVSALRFWRFLFLNLFVFGVLYVLSVFAHECAHALAARLLGMRVFSVSIGCGRVVHRQVAGETVIELKQYPLGGVTLAVPTEADSYRIKMSVMVGSGPLVNFLLVVVATAIVMRGYLPVGHLLVFHQLLVGNLCMLLDALWPRKIQVGGMQIPNDGLALLQLRSLSESDIQERLAWRFCLEGLKCREVKRFVEAEQWCRRGLASHPGNLLLLNVWGVTLLDLGKSEEAREAFSGILRSENLDSGVRSVILNNIASADLLIGRPELLDEADKYSAEAYKQVPWAAQVRGTRGAVLVECGRIGEGLSLLKESAGANEDPRGEAAVACYIALGEMRRENRAEARKYLESARTLDPACLILARVENELRAAEAGNGGG